MQSIRKFDPDKGRTQKGHLYFTAVAGGQRVVDVEDIIAINHRPTLRR